MPDAARNRLGPLVTRLGGTARRVTAAVGTQRTVDVLLLLAALYALVMAASILGVRIWYEAHRPYNVDSVLYWTVGHGISRGLKPYADLYETKPPGIFVLSALSHLLTRDYGPTHVMQILVLLGIAFAPLAFLRPLLRRRESSLERLTLFAALFAFSMTIASYVAHWAGEIQTESFGVFGLVVYALLVGRTGRWAFVARALALAFGIGMKEPFVLVVPLVYLVMHPGTRRPWHDLWGPLIAATGGGAVLMAMLGWLGPYLRLHLGWMVGAHIHLFGSPWNRAMGFELVWNNLKEFSPIMAVGILYCALLYVLSAPASDEAEGSVATRVGRRAQVVVLAIPLVTLAAGMGGHFYPHHFLFGTPYYFALVFMLMSHVARGLDTRMWLRLAIVLLAVLAPDWVKPSVYTEKIRHNAREDLNARDSAAVIDKVLDRLHVDRYQYLGPGGYVPFPFTRHLPQGPMFFQQTAFFDKGFAPFEQLFRRQLAEAKVIVLAQYNAGHLDPEVRNIVETQFHRYPPEQLPPNRNFWYQIFVRNGIAP